MMSSSTDSAVEASASWLWPCVLAVASRPVLWPSAVRLLMRHRIEGWWKQPPFLPRPDPAWMSFRYETAFASPAGRPTADEVVAYLRWCRSWQTLS